VSLSNPIQHQLAMVGASLLALALQVQLPLALRNLAADLGSLSTKSAMQIAQSLPSLLAAKDYCPSSMAGTLVVECAKAEGLDKKAWFSNNSPYCTVLLSDASYEEPRGWMGKMKAAPTSDRMKTATLSDTEDPEWGEAFGFSIVCPHVPDSYQLEVILKHDTIGPNPTLGRVYIPLSKFIYEEQKWQDQTFDLKDGSGQVTLKAKWCALGDHSCIGSLSENTLVDCGQSCHGKLRSAMLDAVKRVEQDVDAADSAARMEAVADMMEDMHDDAGDAAEERHGHEARAQEEYHDQQEDMWDDIGDRYEDKVKKEWKAAVKGASNLPNALLSAARGACHGNLDWDVSSAAGGMHFPKKHSYGAARQARNQLSQVEREIDTIYHKMKHQLSMGHLLPTTSGLQPTCLSYFG